MSLNAGKCTRKCNTLRSVRTRIRTVWSIKLKNNTPNKPYGSVGRNVRARTLPELRVDLARVRLGRIILTRLIILPDWREEEGAILVILRGRRAVQEQGRVGRISPDARIILQGSREGGEPILEINPDPREAPERARVAERILPDHEAEGGPGTKAGAEAGEVEDRITTAFHKFFKTWLRIYETPWSLIFRRGEILDGD